MPGAVTGGGITRRTGRDWNGETYFQWQETTTDVGEVFEEGNYIPIATERGIIYI